jgi:hypothetical protein
MACATTEIYDVIIILLHAPVDFCRISMPKKHCYLLWIAYPYNEVDEEDSTLGRIRSLREEIMADAGVLHIRQVS